MCISPAPHVALKFAPTHEAQLRGQILAVLDRSGYPRLRLKNNSLTGPGLLAWGPVLREMDTHGLERLERQLSAKKTGTGEVDE